MHIFVINLPGSIARREAIERQLRGFGFSYEIFPAISGKTLTDEEKASHYNEKKFIRNTGWRAGAGELGCALSHISIYRLIKERNIPHAFIMEDDVWLNPNLSEILKAIENKYSPEEKNLFLLGWATRISSKNFKPLWSNYRVEEVVEAQGAYSYVVSNAAADVLLKAFYPIQHVADCWTWVHRHRIVQIRAVTPPCITLDMSHESGTLPDLSIRTKKRPILRQLLYKSHRAWWSAWDCAHAWMERLGRSRAEKSEIKG